MYNRCIYSVYAVKPWSIQTFVATASTRINGNEEGPPMEASHSRLIIRMQLAGADRVLATKSELISSANSRTLPDNTSGKSCKKMINRMEPRT